MDVEPRTRSSWSTRKKDPAPRGVYRHPSGDWAIRFTCGAGHIHKQRVGRVKSEDLRTVQELGGWKTLSMVLRYSHLAPSHLHAAVERLVPADTVELARN